MAQNVPGLTSSHLLTTLETTSIVWCVGNEADLCVCVENPSDRHVYLDLGDLGGAGTESTTALAAAGLQVEILGKRLDGLEWACARKFEPRPARGCQAAPPRARALYLPPCRGARLLLRGRVHDTHAGSAAWSIGGKSCDAAEALVPLARLDDMTGEGQDAAAQLGYRCRVRFHIDVGREMTMLTDLRSVVEAHGQRTSFAWVGPFEPRCQPGSDAIWVSAVSAPLDIRVIPVGASTLLPAPPMASLSSRPRRRCASQRPRRKRFGTQSGAGADSTAGNRCSSAIRPDATASARSNGMSVLNETADEPLKTLAVKSRPGGSAVSATSVAQNVSAPAVASATSAAANVASSGIGVFRAFHCGAWDSTHAESEAMHVQKSSKLLPRLPRVKSPCSIAGPEHGSRWRRLPRHQDPLADPLLLELAEVVEGMRSKRGFVALCGDWLKTRTGQRFVSSLRALGHRIVVAPETRNLAGWAETPRRDGGQEELMLVVHWKALVGAANALRAAIAERGLGLALLGVVGLCDRGDETKVAGAAVAADLPCPWRVMSSVAFAC